METPPPGFQPTKHERWHLRKQEKEAARNHSVRSRKFKRWATWLLVIGGSAGLFVWWAASQKPIPEEDVVARRGLHWHPELTISIKGQQQDIPANLGIGAVHNPIHTHDSTGVLHLEFEGRRVTKDDIRLGQFFKLWDKPFSSSCIFDTCNGSDGQLKMTVNGKPNTAFDQYIMRDKDKIEIRYE